LRWVNSGCRRANTTPWWLLALQNHGAVWHHHADSLTCCSPTAACVRGVRFTVYCVCVVSCLTHCLCRRSDAADVVLSPRHPGPLQPLSSPVSSRAPVTDTDGDDGAGFALYSASASVPSYHARGLGAVDAASSATSWPHPPPAAKQWQSRMPGDMSPRRCNGMLPLAGATGYQVSSRARCLRAFAIPHEAAETIVAMLLTVRCSNCPRDPFSTRPF
jgi:hypothetical protein